MKQINLIGSYHNRPIEIYTKIVKIPSNTVTIFVQGLYGVFSITETGDKINLLSENLSSIIFHIASVIIPLETFLSLLKPNMKRE